MKKLSSYLFCTLLCGSCYGQFSIRGAVKGLHAGTIRLYSQNEVDNGFRVIDSAVFSRDSFFLKGRLDQPGMLTMTINPGNWSFHVFAENGDMRISADTSGSEHFDYTKYGGAVSAWIKDVTV